jgi:putative ABC transport system ATP-binding protein
MIELNNVSKNYGSTRVLNEVNLTINEGEFVSIRGKSGVGKTTLLRIIGFLETPDKGQVKLYGKETNKLNDAARSHLRLNNIGFVFQFFNLIPSLTVLENIELPLALAGSTKSKRDQRTTELISYFGLGQLAQRFPDTLSGGEKQRIAVMRALVNNPKIIIADEPTSSLDDENSQLLMNLLTKTNQEKKVTLIMTTTDLCEGLPATSDYTLKDGQVNKTARDRKTTF